MPLDWQSGPLADGLHCYRTQQFFLAHEHWEDVWLACDEPEKTMLQCLIQISAAFHHLQRGNRRGTVSLLTRALRRLGPYPAALAGVSVETVRQSVREWLSLLSAEETNPQLPYPPIP